MDDRLPDLTEMALAIAENSAQGIVVMNADGTCLYANRGWAELTGFTAADMGTTPVHDWVHHHRPDGRPLPLHECPIGCTLGRAENVRNHYDVFFRRDGSPFDVSCSASTLSTGAGPELKILEIRDATEEIQAARRNDEFLAMLAHELRNPLAPIAAAADLLKLGRLDAAGVARASAVIGRQVGHMTSLIDDLLDVSRVTRGQIELGKEVLDLKTVVAEAVEQVRPLVEARHHWLLVEGTPDTAVVLGDRKRLVQTVANVLSNAAKYTPPGGEISVRIGADAGAAEIHVTDNGIGMSAEMCERAFDLFSQAQRTSDRAQGGLGIGLALVRSLVNLHDGRVKAHSAGPGKGTTISIRLPVFAGGAAPAGPVAATGPLSAAGRALDIMVVDDGVDAAEMLGLLLTAFGHRVRIEHAPEAALAAAQAASYDVFLLDIGLPGMDGTELARAIRRQPRNAGATLIAVTGYGQEQDRHNTRDAGFDHHLVKPTDLDALAALLQASALGR